MRTINKVFLILFVSLLASDLFAQSDLPFGSKKPEINTFVQKVERAGDLTAAVQADDGGYVTTSRIDGTSFLVMKIKVSGQRQWERRLNFPIGSNPYLPFASIAGIAQTTDGGFVLVGQAGVDYYPFEESTEATLVKLRPNGTVAWQKSFGVSGLSGQSFSSRFLSVIAMSDGGVIAIGAIVQDRGSLGSPLESLVVRFAATGDVVWGKNFKPIADVSTIPAALPLITSTATPDNGFIVASQTGPLNNRPLNGVNIIKTNNLGNAVWEKSLNSDDFVFQSMGVTVDGGVILVGTGVSTKLKVVVLKADGTLNWKAGYSPKVPGGIQSVSSPVQTPDGGYVVTGSTYDTPSKKGYGFIAKIDSSRNIAFQHTFGNGPPPRSCSICVEGKSSVFAAADGDFVLFGNNGLGLLVSKVNPEGIVPGCSFFNSLGTTTHTSFGPLKIGPVKITTPNDLSVEPLNFRLRSVVTNHPVSTVCQ